jgi:hypothetical protein
MVKRKRVNPWFIYRNIARLAVCYHFRAFVHSPSLAPRHRFHCTCRYPKDAGNSTYPVYLSDQGWLVVGALETSAVSLS